MSEKDQVGGLMPEAQLPRVGFLRELWDFVRENKKWWLLPVVIVLLLIGVLVILGSTSALAPLIYTVF